MEIKTTAISANRLTARENVQFLQEGDIIVPDNKPDIEKILRTSGNVVIDSTNIADGRLNYRGHIALDCLYLSKGENKKLHTMSKDIEINDFIAISGIEENMSPKLKCTIENIDTGILNERKINKKLFLESEYANEVEENLTKYKGKHSLLSIIFNDIEEKADGYVKKRVHPALYKIMGNFIAMSVNLKHGNHGELGKIGVSHEILSELQSGTLNVEDEEELDKAEELLNNFFIRTYSDIKEVFYKREKVDEKKFKYVLYFKKKIYGNLVDVSYNSESTGTLHLLNILPYLLMSVEGSVVVIDELDTGIHDLLVENLLNSIIDSIGGQLIITTHNTMILDSEINPEYIYTFVVDRDAKKELVPIVEFEDRMHPNLNYRNRYLKGMYGGIPNIADIDFGELKDILD